VRAQQDQHCDGEDLKVAALVVEHQVTVFAQFVHGPEQEGGPDNEGLSDQQDQSADWIIDIEEPDQLGLGSNSSRYKSGFTNAFPLGGASLRG
jgi:hypothetical protein